jgi:hypothetical protein
MALIEECQAGVRASGELLETSMHSENVVIAGGKV